MRWPSGSTRSNQGYNLAGVSMSDRAAREKARRRALFDDGAQAYRRYVPADFPRVYFCPVCATGFDQDEMEQLTDDHVPSKRLPGKHVRVLTCKDCNSTAGSGLQKDMLVRERAIQFLTETMTERSRGEGSIEGLRFDMEYIRHAGGIEMHVSDTPRNRLLMPDGGKVVGRKLMEGAPITISPREGFREQRARVALLREAYLAAFAVFGYGYAYSAQLARVHAQLDDPESTVIPRFLSISRQATGSERVIALVREPQAESGSLCVQIGRYVILLPWLEGDVYDRIASASRTDEQETSITLRYLVDWPKSPMYLLDRGLVPGMTVTVVSEATGDGQSPRPGEA